MPLGMEVGLSPGDFELDGDPAAYPKMCGAPNFRPTSIVAKRLHGSRFHLVGGRPRPTRVGLGLRAIVFDVNPATPR